ncbi:MAG: hypothetical protein F9K32_04355 [Desulfobulbaceae bacterium]|nr:MAG: hypothetical protein F9K32_04355 [Desulfobulbaceae bacterium]
MAAGPFPPRYAGCVAVLVITAVIAGIATARADQLPTTPASRRALAEALLAAVERHTDPGTGLAPSYLGDQGAIARYGAQIYDTGLRLLADSRHSPAIIATFAAGHAGEGRPGRPQTLAAAFSPASGIFSWVRVGGFAEPRWWNDWEWSVKAGENAWLGLGALHMFKRTGDPRALEVARERADFLMALQDADGGIRIGPRGLAEDFWWRRKSCENNESAIAFLDALAGATADRRYREAADRVYGWLVAEMYDHDRHLFRRGEVEEEGGWRRDGIDVFAADTVNWLPVDRILLDPRFGKDRPARLAEVERMVEAMLGLCGVRQNGVLKGVSYSPRSQAGSVISLEWSAQYALLCLRLSREFEREGLPVRAAHWRDRYEDILIPLAGFIARQDGEAAAPHAVFPDGRVAVGAPMWDDIVLTPSAFLSAASHLYLAFALREVDPLRMAD